MTICQIVVHISHRRYFSTRGMVTDNGSLVAITAIVLLLGK